MNTLAVCNSFKAEALTAIHALGTTVIRASTAPDVLKAALYLASASLGAGTTAYSTTGEAVGAGYTAGGIIIPNTAPPSVSDNVGIWTPSGNFVFPNVTLATAFDAVLIYNSTQGNRAIGVSTFGAQTIAGTFTLTMPANDAANALIRYG